MAEEIGRTTPSRTGNERWMRSVRLFSGNGGVALMIQKQRGGPDLDWITLFSERLYHRHESPLRAGEELMEGRKLPWNRLGFFCIAWQRRDEYDVTIDVPYWWLTALMLVYPARRLRHARRRRAEDRRLCGQCGYDLRASGDGYPECGMARPGKAHSDHPPTEAHRAGGVSQK